MKILILSCSTGEGHNSAAYAMQDAFTKRGAVCEVADPLGFGGSKPKRVVANTYNNIIKNTPAVFGAIYKVGSLYSSTRLPSPVYYANTLYAKRLNKYIIENGFDAVVCTHLFAMEAMTCIRRKMNNSVPCYGILTDYTCIPFFAETEIDGYFIPHEDIRRELVEKNVPDECIFSTGIPVRADFFRHTDKLEAREQLNIPQDEEIFLIMTGGVGCGNVIGLCDELIRLQKRSFRAYVLVGNNNQMKEEIEEHFGSDGRIEAVPFTKKVSLYMNAADVLITKSGGISSTEAAVANIALVHLMTIPGCETKNAEFFEQRGMSCCSDTVEKAARLAWELACDKEKSERMRAMQRKHINSNAADETARMVMGV